MIDKSRKEKILAIDWVKRLIKSDWDDCTVECKNGHIVEVSTKSMTRTDYRKHCPECKKEKKVENVSSCLKCGKTLKPGQLKFCSNSCSASYNNSIRKLKPRNIHVKNKQMDKCPICGVEKPKNRKYCSKKCLELKREKDRNEKLLKINTENISTQKVPSRVRESLFIKFNNSCQKCGWSTPHPRTGKVPLQVHHIDGDPNNNSLSNLELLCPNCHSLTDSYGNKNLGFGRESRRKYRYKNNTSN